MRNSPLTLEQVRQCAPSVFAAEPDASRSDRYTYIPTSRILEGMMDSGFFPFKASQSHVRDSARREHTKHMIRFRQESNQAIEVGDSIPEVVLINAHDGTSRYKLLAGIFRLVCSNGLVVSESMFASISIKHTGNIVEQVVAGSQTVIDSIPQTLEVIRQWKELELTEGEQTAFAESAHVLRFGDSEGNVNTPIQPKQLLAPRRDDDNGGNLWNTFNRVQENAVKGGLSAIRRDENGRRIRRIRSREVTGIDQDVKLNRALWQLAERMAELKQAS